MLHGVKVALLSDCYLPRLGGIEVQTHDLATHLRDAGHEVEIFTATGNGDPSRSTVPTVEDGLRVHRFDLGLPGGLPINPFVTGEVGRRLAEGGFDVGHVQMGVISPFAVDMARVTLGAGLPLAVTWHCVIDGSAPLHRSMGYAARWAERGGALSAVSGMAAERVESILRPGQRVGVLPNGIDVEVWRRPTPRVVTTEVESEAPASVATEAGSAVGAGPIRIVAAQRMAPRKRPEALIDALLRARTLVPERIALQATVVGDGKLRQRLQERLDRDGVDWISLPGRVTRDELRELHWASDVFVSAARLEAFGIAALEARTAGLALVVREGTGASDFVEEGVSGLSAGSDAALGDAVARLATDRALLERIQKHNTDVAPVQDWPRVVDLALGEYDRAIAQRPRP